MCACACAPPPPPPAARSHKHTVVVSARVHASCSLKRTVMTQCHDVAHLCQEPTAEPEPSLAVEATRGDRFAETLPIVPYGVASERRENWTRFCSEDSDGLNDDAKACLRECRKHTENNVEAILRSWTHDALYRQVNRAVLDDCPEKLRTHGGYIRACTTLSATLLCTTHMAWVCMGMTHAGQRSISAVSRCCAVDACDPEEGLSETETFRTHFQNIRVCSINCFDKN